MLLNLFNSTPGVLYDFMNASTAPRRSACNSFLSFALIFGLEYASIFAFKALISWMDLSHTTIKMGACLQLAGGTIVYKCKFQPTIAGSSTEAEFMATYDTGKMNLYVRSILWDLGIPQEVATVMHEDNDACTAMGNAQKPTPRTRHMDIKYILLCNWVERDLMQLERVDTKLNMADMFTKNLPRLVFYRRIIC